jgi:hypothetical protein
MRNIFKTDRVRVRGRVRGRVRAHWWSSPTGLRGRSIFMIATVRVGTKRSLLLFLMSPQGRGGSSWMSRRAS